MTRAAFFLFVFLGVAGCMSTPAVVRSFIDRKGAPVVHQSGEAKEPATASVQTSSSVITLPGGSVVRVPSGALRDIGAPEASFLEVTLSKPTELRTEGRIQAVSGAKSFAPPSPPSAAEKARADGVRWFYLAGAACGVFSLIAFFVGFPRAGVVLAVGAVGMPAVGLLVSSVAALIVLGVCAAGAFAYWHSWHVLKSPAA